MSWMRTMMILMIMMMTINQRELVRKAAEGEKGQPETEVAYSSTSLFLLQSVFSFIFQSYSFVLHNPEMLLICFFSSIYQGCHLLYYSALLTATSPHNGHEAGKKTIMSRSTIIKVNDMRNVKQQLKVTKHNKPFHYLKLY